MAIIQNTRNLINIKSTNALQSGSGLDIGLICYEWQSKAVFISRMLISIMPNSWFFDDGVLINPKFARELEARFKETGKRYPENQLGSPGINVLDY